MNAYQDELLTILTEECGEAIQEICKIKRFGLLELSHHRKGKTHLHCLEQEIGDILTMVELLFESGIGLTEEGLAAAMAKKREKLEQWMTNKKPTLPVDNSIDIMMQKTYELAQQQLNNYKAKIRRNSENG